MMMTSKLNKADIRRVFVRYIALNCLNDYPGQMHGGYVFSMLPALKKIYGDDEVKLNEALMRHQEEYFNVTPAIAGLPMGITLAMEEQNAQSDDFDTSTISGMKTALMGPLSAIGDTVFPATLRIIATAMVTQMAAKGSVLAPILFFLLWNIPNFLARYYSLKFGYNLGSDFIIKSAESNMMQKVSYACSVVGLMAIGAMCFVNIKISTPLVIGGAVKGGAMKLQTTLDTIMPGMLSLLVVGIVYWLLDRGVKVVPLLLGTMVIGFILNLLGIIA
ncbi:PTS system mannose/fructose/sorbose family transporter subunit IID [Lacticaseibacillus baoqingensis]|uniref:PTS system mannose/fructose/sorbose family transporter subunit IID n=1 Tax=Lacticaseibacillus baoqingensis TaxID=2486013 RepID=A0ABW4E8R3_9LACO|nr:PTS system mannose/fructose/sorbose family transporter subunit IID [Lacticaseibacillus baoqingensis]